MSVRAFYDTSYGQSGFGAQRRYPNEELCRFMGRHFFALPLEKRGAVRVLEAGCGSGANLWMIAREGFDAYGVDLSSNAIDLCRQMLRSYGTEATLDVGDMTATPYPAGHFDAVVDVFSSNCFDNAGHARFLDEVRRLLKPGGRFFSFTPSKASRAFIDHSPARKIDDSTLEGIHRTSSPYYGNNYAFRFTSAAEYGADLERRGMRVAEAETVSRTYRNREEYFEFVVVTAVAS